MGVHYPLLGRSKVLRFLLFIYHHNFAREMYLEPARAENHFVVSRDESTSWNEEDEGHSHQNSYGVYIQL